MEPTWEDLEGTIVDVVREDGQALGRDAPVHPGALLVAWQHYAPTQLAFKGIAPGRRYSTIAVVSEWDPPDPIGDEAAALDVAIQHAAEHHPELRGKPLLVDVPGDESTIRAALEGAAVELANEHFVEGLSTLGDQASMDLEEWGYDPESVVIIATAGDAVAVNGDLLVDSYWEKTLGLAKSQHPQLWTEATGHRKTGHRKTGAISLLENWLTDHGYEQIEKLGGHWPGGEEEEIDKRVLVERVAESEKLPEPLVRKVADAYKGDYIVWGSDSGYAKTRAKPKPRRTRSGAKTIT